VVKLSAIPSHLILGGGSHLIAALSIFIGLVGTALWSLAAFVIHQCRATPNNEDAVFFQQQVVYRNQASILDAFFDILKICWAWRRRKAVGKRVDGLERRSFLFSLPPLLIFVAFTVAPESSLAKWHVQLIAVTMSKLGAQDVDIFAFDTSTAEGAVESESATSSTKFLAPQAKAVMHDIAS
jgi:hypothetical protein